MLRSPFRIKKNKDFQKVLKKGECKRSNLLFVVFLKNELQNSRFGFVVSLKVSKKATERNLIKRRLREIVRLNLDKIKEGYDIVIIAKKQANKATYQDLK